jgi:drug/metabolite transporter (DMT)-like permease
VGDRQVGKVSEARPRRPKSTRLALGALVVVCLIWGYNFVVMKTGLRYSGPWDFVALRNVGGAVALFILVLVTRRPFRPQAPGYSLALGLLQVTGNLGLVVWALSTGAVGRTSVLTYAMPFWVLILAWPVLGERIQGFQWIAIGVALLGLVFIFNPIGAHGTIGATVIAFGSGVCWAGATILTRILHRRRHVDLLSLASWQMLFGAIPLVVIALLVPQRPMDWQPLLVIALLFNMICANVIAWSLWLFVLRHVRAGTASVGTLAAPPVGILGSWLQLGEVPSPFEAVGIALIVVALAILSVIAIRRRDDSAVSEEPAG